MKGKGGMDERGRDERGRGGREREGMDGWEGKWKIPS